MSNSYEGVHQDKKKGKGVHGEKERLRTTAIADLDLLFVRQRLI